MDKPELAISVVIPVYNRALSIDAALRSVTAQTLPPTEIIVVDDGSTDSTREAVQKCMQKDSRIQYAYQANAGAGAARNLGILRSKCEWVAFLDSDDCWRPSKLENAAAAVRASDEVEFIHSNRRLRFPDGREEPGRTGVTAEQLANKLFLLETFLIKTSTVLVRRTLLNRLDRFFPENRKTCEDYEFFWRAVAEAKAIAYSQAPDTVIHMDDDGLSRRADQANLIRDNILALGQASRALAQSHPQMPFARILHQRQYWECRELLSLNLKSRALPHILSAMVLCAKEHSAPAAFRAAASAVMSVLRQGKTTK